MGSVSLKIGDGTARFHRSTLCSSVVRLLMLFSVLVTNLFALYAFTSSPHPHSTTTTTTSSTSSLADHVSSILRDIESSERTLYQISRDVSGYPSLDPTSPSLPHELRSFLSRQPLPLGKDSRSGITELASSVSHSCLSPSPDPLRQFMSYRPRAPCPSPDHPHLPLKLLSLSCDPLPRRRCLSRSSPPPPHTTANPTKTSDSKNDFSVDDVLSLSPPGAVRIGFDVDAPNADFAAAMAVHNVTVVTSSGGWIHRDGLLTLNITPRRRFPFYDNVFDLVRMVKGLDGGDAMEFFMFDIDRVLRPGGLLWLDSYYCVDGETKTTVTRLVDKFGYKKLKWVVGEKAGLGKGRVYLSAVLRKPVRG
ncbi:uncharacterized protein M6B38_372965 [Iris pallida]|uniref:S-adenosyl-L-methionine-dependent methyltransferase superfamily protein n=1 Tax=Iris pallida TaxID=29817 RepID=A0AAX6GCY7_IRIPA|nr:uncharacterized protein M6B38_372965 [Iris pallida]